METKNDRIIKKWKPVMDQVVGISREDMLSVCKHINNLSSMHSKYASSGGPYQGMGSVVPNPPKTIDDVINKLAMELKIISKLDSLLNVVFISKPFTEINEIKEGIRDYKYDFYIGKEFIDFFTLNSTSSSIDHVESIIIEDMVNRYDKLIKKYDGLFIYNIIQSILSEDMGDKIKISVTSRYKIINN
jgi:hypothetical protein